MNHDTYQANPRDLEVLVTLLEIAAIELTSAPRTVFTVDQLFRAVHQYDEPKCTVDDRDLRIILPYCSFLQRLPGRMFHLR